MSNSPEKSSSSKKTKDSHSITESYEILDGAVKVLRTTKSGNFWSMSCWLREEGKCYRKSLRTKNLEEAKEFARERYFELKADIKAGNAIYSKTAQELVDEFIQHKTNEANANIITHERVNTIKICLNKWFLNFVGKTTKLDKINRNDFETYFVWRRNKAMDVRDVTLVNERAMISSLFKFGINKGYLRADQNPTFPKFRRRGSKVERRDAFDLEEWEQMFRSFRRWISKSVDEKEAEQRRFIRDFIILKANTGLRFGELRKLKWSMVKTYKVDQLNKRKEKQVHAQIFVPVDTKTGDRIAIGRRGDIFHRIKAYSQHKKADDWIFADNETGNQIHKKVYYKQWKSLLQECGLEDCNKKLTYYSLRHTYITFRLYAGTNPFFLAENAGTSLKYIEDNYAHIKTDLIKHDLTKDIKLNEAGEILLGDT